MKKRVFSKNAHFPCEKKIISKFLTKSQKLQKPEKFQEYRPKRIIKFDKVNQICANTATKIEHTQFSKKTSL